MQCMYCQSRRTTAVAELPGIVVYDCRSCFRHSYGVIVKGEHLKSVSDYIGRRME